MKFFVTSSYSWNNSDVQRFDSLDAATSYALGRALDTGTSQRIGGDFTGQDPLTLFMVSPEQTDWRQIPADVAVWIKATAATLLDRGGR